MTNERTFEDSHFAKFMRPQGAPRGLLAYYVLHTIAKKPAHGYEILQDIESKTEGAWRPGAGSIYPILKKYSSEKYIKSEPSKSKLPTASRIYEITQKGKDCLNERTEKFFELSKHWGSMRRIFIDFIKPEQLSKFLVDGTRVQFEMWQETFISKEPNIPEHEAQYVLREYELMLERQMDWVKRKSEDLASRSQKIEIKKKIR